MFSMRERWIVAVGVTIAILLPVVVGVFGVGEQSAIWTDSLLGIRFGVWGTAATIAALSFALQLVFEGRDSLQRERRLVQTAAALREATAQLERLATTDALTGILNRRAFFDRYGVEFRRSMRYGRPLAVIMIDLDDFKLLNDRWGHPFGDYMLAEMARVISTNLRESDVIARYGGEEFVVLLPETTRESAATVAEKLRGAVAEHEFRSDTLPPSGQSPERVTISAGVTALPTPMPVDSDELVSRADRALYRAKRAGKNRVEVDEGQPGPDAAPDPPSDEANEAS